jgi:hypothetical protein
LPSHRYPSHRYSDGCHLAEVLRGECAEAVELEIRALVVGEKIDAVVDPSCSTA